MPSQRELFEHPLIVGIGASAGGLEALQSFFDQTPADSGAAYVVVQHLSPDYKSLMDEILARHTTMKIVRVEKPELIQPDHVYLIPPRYDIRVDGEHLRVDPQPDDRTIQHTINVFFDSMATSRRGACIAIVLSGTGTDGAIGVRAVKESGGIVMVQDPESARFDGMPRAAIATGVVDFDLEPTQLAGKVAELIEHPTISNLALEPQDITDQIPKLDSALEIVESETGLPFRSYKTGTIGRRMLRRMTMHRITSIAEYTHKLRSDSAECRALARDCLIHVTRFFRDPEAFESLEAPLRSLVTGQSTLGKPLRVWVVGCSTGEEAYSIAIQIEKIIEESGMHVDYKVFATDVDGDAVDAASLGRFGRGSVLGLEDDDASRFFVTDGETLVAAPRLRNRMVFARHNVLTDPPFPNANLVVCRNLLIYLKPAAQRKALERMHYSLVTGGCMFLGPSEILDALASDYRTIDAKWRLFEKISERVSKRYATNPYENNDPITPLRPRGRSRNEFGGVALQRACESLISQLAVCGIVINGSGEIVFTFGDTTRFLTLPRGNVTTKLEDLLPKEVATPTKLAMRQSRASGEVVRVAGVSLGDDSEGFELSVMHLDKFEQAGAVDVVLVAEQQAVKRTPDQIILEPDDAARAQIEALEAELQSTRESLQTTIEELETTNEEMQSVNEELLSSNEELQSTNEELHSVNEELYTVNAEHQSKIAELADVTEDLENLLTATQIGMVFVDGDLCVRRFTPDVKIGLPLRESDIGRGLGELSSRVDVDLVSVVGRVLKTREPWESRVVTTDGVPVLIAARPHGTSYTAHEGCVLTIVDLTHQEVQRGDEQVRELVARALAVSATDVLWVRDLETGRFRHVGSAFESIWGVPARECLEDPTTWSQGIAPEDRARVAGALETPNAERLSFGYRIVRPDGGSRWIEHRTFGAFDVGGNKFVCGVAVDETERMTAESEARARSELMRQALERTGMCVTLLRDGDKVMWANDAARNLLRTNEGLRDTLGSAVVDRAQRKQLIDAIASIAEGAGERATVVVDWPAEGRERSIAEFQLETLEPKSADRPGITLCQWIDRTADIAREAELRKRNSQLEAQAHTDALTGLLNRRGLEQSLREDLALCSRSGDTVVVLLIDCDKFKSINDEHSHSIGDRVLVEISNRMRRVLRPSDTIGRIGGDEFVVVLPATRIAEGAHVAEKLRRVMSEEAFQVEGTSIAVTVSIGVASAQPSARRIDELIGYADSLLQRSKLSGRNQVSFVSDGQRRPIQPAPDLIERLLGPDGVAVALQAINDVGSGEPVGYEMLARGADLRHGPAEFFAVARTTGRLEALDLHCLDACLKRVDELANAARCHVNVFPSTLLAADAERIFELLGAVQNPSGICIELSEQQFIGPSSALRERLTQLRRMGFKIALDDVGFGRSALESLLAVEPDVVKIDRSLVYPIDGDRGMRRPFEQLVAMMAGLPVEIIAEGVERPTQHRILQDLGVPLAQGYLWSNPDQN